MRGECIKFISLSFSIVSFHKPVLYRFNPPLQQTEWQAFAWKIPAVLTKSSDVFDEKSGCFG